MKLLIELLGVRASSRNEWLDLCGIPKDHADRVLFLSNTEMSLVKDLNVSQMFGLRLVETKYYKVTGASLSFTGYYSAYNLDDAREVVKRDFGGNNVDALDFEEVEYADIPSGGLINIRG